MKNNACIRFVVDAYRAIIKGTSYLQSPFLLAIRLYWGWQFFLSGKGKLQNIDRTVEFFTELRVPFPHFNVLLAATTEAVGGLFLLAGLASRLTAVPLIATMCVAYLTAHLDVVKGIFGEDGPDNFVSAPPFLFLMVSFVILVFGPGKLSLDHLIGRMFPPTPKEK